MYNLNSEQIGDCTESARWCKFRIADLCCAAKIHVLDLYIVQLFNASALIESRSSTRLGQNVKLLTYVSIVYPPLAFCAVSTSK